MGQEASSGFYSNTRAASALGDHSVVRRQLILFEEIVLFLFYLVHGFIDQFIRYFHKCIVSGYLLKNIGTGYPHNKGPFTSNDSETRWQPQMSNKYHVVACDDEVSAMIYDEVVLQRCFFSAIGGYCDILLNILPIFPQSKPPDEAEERNGGEYDYWDVV